MLRWLLCILFVFILVVAFIPRKKEEPMTHEDLSEHKRNMYQLFLKEEKDTKRFFNDIRSLYPLRTYNKRTDSDNFLEILR